MDDIDNLRESICIPLQSVRVKGISKVTIAVRHNITPH